jgi:hypothetical protein
MSFSLQRKQLTVFVANDKNLNFQANKKRWETCVHHHESENFSMLKDFLMQ